MSEGLKATFQFLSKTPNAAAVEVLVAGLECPHQVVRHHALRGLMDRRDPAGHHAIFERLDKLDETSREIINERPERLVGTVKEAIHAESLEDCRAACEAIVKYRLYPAITAMVGALGDKDYPYKGLVAQSILDLTESFYGELSGSTGGSKASKKGQQALRSRITTALEDATRKYHRHECLEVVEALMIIALSRNVALRTMLQRREGSSHKPIIQALTESERGGVIRLLLGFLEDPQMPRAVLEVIEARSDPKFVDHLLRTIGPKPTKLTCDTLLQMKSIGWAEPDHKVFPRISGEAHEGAVEMLKRSGMERSKVLDMIGFILLNGKPLGRRAAARALIGFQEPKAAALAVQGLSDEDSIVRANLVIQIRPRKIPGALSLLIGMVDNPPEELRKALCTAMPEFSLHQFLGNFDAMDAEMQVTAGHIVQKIDSDIGKTLRAELEGPSPVRRRRALQAALAMGVISEIEDKVIESVSDSDHMVRVAAAEALAECKSIPSWEALRDAMFDRSVVVQEAAEGSLQRISSWLTKGVNEGEESEEDEEDEEAQEEKQEISQ